MNAIRRAFTRPLISQKIRTFSKLSEAADFINSLTAANRTNYRFNIVQQDNRWTVCRVISGGV